MFLNEDEVTLKDTTLTSPSLNIYGPDTLYALAVYKEYTVLNDAEIRVLTAIGGDFSLQIRVKKKKS